MIDHCLMHTKNLSQIYSVDGALVGAIRNNTSIIALSLFLSLSCSRSFFLLYSPLEICLTIECRNQNEGKTKAIHRIRNEKQTEKIELKNI